MTTIGERIIAALQQAGVRRLFGMPGGGSNADLVAAANKLGLPFSLAHTETASALMASAQAEITGCPGACIATLGPGAAAIMNGMAHAYLDRVPIMVITDCHPANAAHMQHQNLAHSSMLAPITKFSATISRENACETLNGAIEALSIPPPGPVHLDISAPVTSSVAENWGERSLGTTCVSLREEIPPPSRQTLRRMRRPAFLVGLAARSAEIAKTLGEMSAGLGIPALVTYKAKGVIPDQHPWFMGLFTNGALERDALERADGFIAVGLDPVELLPVPWRLTKPVVSISPWPIQQQQIPISAEFVGNVAGWLTKLLPNLPAPTEWTQPEVAQLREAQQKAMRPPQTDGLLSPHRVVQIVADVYSDVRVTVDAGAHMFPVMSLWPAKKPCGVLISNGLSTMGFALPAAIGAALLDSSVPVVAFTGDGGLMMCLGELRTAARENLPVRIIVFDDRVLSLIKIKQIKRGYNTDGVAIGEVNWVGLAESMGVLGRRADTEDRLLACLRETATHPGPVLMAARISEQTYPETMRALRG